MRKRSATGAIYRARGCKKASASDMPAANAEAHSAKPVEALFGSERGGVA
jgi:hypothetical protein